MSAEPGSSRESDSALDLDSEDLEEDTDSDDTVTDDPTTSDDNMDPLVTDSGRASPDRDMIPEPEGTNLQQGKDEIEMRFLDAGSSIFSKLRQLENEMNLLKVAKDKAVSDIDVYFDHLVHVINRRRQLLKGEVMGAYENRVEALEETQEKVTFSSMCLATLKKHAEEILSKSTDKTMRRARDMIVPRINEHRQEAENLGLWQNFLEFDGPPNRELEKTLRRVGQIRSASCLPSKVDVKQARYKLLNPSEVVLQIAGFSGQLIDPSLVERKLVEVLIKDPKGHSVPCRAKHDCGVWAVSFIPRCSGIHSLDVDLLGEDVARLPLKIPKSRPLGLIGREHNFKSLNGIALDEEGDMFLTDVGLNLLFRFSPIGEQKWKCDFGSYGLICFDIAWSQENNMLICSVNEIGGAGGMRLDGEETEKKTDSKDAPNVADTKKNVETRMVEFPDGTQCLCMLKKAFVGLVEKSLHDNDSQTEVILSDPNKNVVSVFDLEGTHKGDLSFPDLDCPAFVAYSMVPQRSILVAESGKSLIRRCHYVGGGEGTEGEAIGNSTQLSSCVGVASDEQGFVLVADSSNGCLQVFDPCNAFHGTLEADPGPGRKFHPWSLAITKSGQVWVVDKDSQTVQKYQYKENK